MTRLVVQSLCSYAWNIFHTGAFIVTTSGKLIKWYTMFCVIEVYIYFNCMMYYFELYVFLDSGRLLTSYIMC